MDTQIGCHYDGINSSVLEEDNTDETEMREEYRFGEYTDGKDLSLNLDLIRPLSLEHEFDAVYNNDLEGEEPVTVQRVMEMIADLEGPESTSGEGENEHRLEWTKDTSKSLKAYTQLTVSKSKEGSPLY